MRAARRESGPGGGRYTVDSRDRVRDAVDMLQLVSSRTELRRAGVDSYFGL